MLRSALSLASQRLSSLADQDFERVELGGASCFWMPSPATVPLAGSAGRTRQATGSLVSHHPVCANDAVETAWATSRIAVISWCT